jgi:cytoskeletal protein CcmA (bactofilin family)
MTAMFRFGGFVFKRRKSDDSEAIHGHSAGFYDAAEGEATEGRATSNLAGSRIGALGVSVLSLPSKPADTGLGVPPFRPAHPMEGQPMGRSPLNTQNAVPATQQPPGTRSVGAPIARLPVREPADRRMLVVGRGISLQGTVQDAERLVVEGTVEASTIQASELAITPGGVFKGEIEVEDAEIAGTMDGTLTVRASLVVRTTGRVLGTARCRRLQVEDGGQISGRVEMLIEPSKLEASRAAESVA